MNPAVSVAMLMARKIDKKDFGIYLIGQFAGAFLAGLALLLIFNPSIELFEASNQMVRGAEGSQLSAMMFGEYYPNPGFAEKISLSLSGAIALEAFGTFLLVIMIFFLTEKSDQIDNFIPLMIGLTVTIIITLIAPFTQAGLNPARDFGPRMVAWIGGWGDMAFPDFIWWLVLGVHTWASLGWNSGIFVIQPDFQTIKRVKTKTNILLDENRIIQRHSCQFSSFASCPC